MKPKPPAAIRAEPSGVFVKLPIPADLLSAVADMRDAADDVIALVGALRDPGKALLVALNRGALAAERAAEATHKLAKRKRARKAKR